MNNEQIQTALKNWREMIEKYQIPNNKKAVLQILTSYLPYLGLWVLMYFSLGWSYSITLVLSTIAAFFLVRIFIIQHDCGHLSFFRSRKLNDLFGILSSFFSTIPYRYWSSVHSSHHAHNGQMEHRGIGDITFLTTEEYKNSTNWKKFTYRVFRSPIVLFCIAPVVYFVFNLRYPLVRLRGWLRIRRSFFTNNLLLLIVYIGLILIIGWKNFLMVQLPILFVFSVIAFWFFYVQHAHEQNYKVSSENWNHLLASIRGSTYYKLPRFFHWLTGNIGYHHIHHLSSRIPSYHLKRCSVENPVLNQYVTALSFRESLKTMRYKLWDPNDQRMISFKEYKQRYL